MPDIEVAAPPKLSTLVFRYRPAPWPEDDVGRLNARIRAELFAAATAMVAGDQGRRLAPGSSSPCSTRWRDASTTSSAILDEIREIGADLELVTIARPRRRWP